MPLDRTGLMIIRAWVEPGSLRPLRARIRLTTNVGTGFESEMMLSDLPAITTAVELWIQDVLLDADLPPA